MSSGLTPNELQALSQHHQFIRDDERDAQQASDWQVRLARRYYDKLYKEYAIVDLSQAETTKKLGVRWRTEKEVLSGKGETQCAERKCVEYRSLRTLETPFSYVEEGKSKMELVKVRVCENCAKIMQTIAKSAPTPTATETTLSIVPASTSLTTMATSSSQEIVKIRHDDEDSKSRKRKSRSEKHRHEERESKHDKRKLRKHSRVKHQ
jgi:protein FRA10AC1